MFPSGQTFTQFATKAQSNSKLTFSFSFKNLSTSLMTFDVVLEVTMLYLTIPVFVNMISSQNGAITTANGSGNDVGEKLVNGFPKLSRPLELI